MRIGIVNNNIVNKGFRTQVCQNPINKNINQPMNPDSVSFTGGATQIKLPITEIEAILNKSFAKIKKAGAIEEKQVLINGVSDKIRGCIDSLNLYQKVKNPSELKMLDSFVHDSYNCLRISSKNEISNDLEKNFKHVISNYLGLCQDYQELFNSNCFDGKNPKEIFEVALNFANKKLKGKNLKVNILNEEVLKDKDLKNSDLGSNMETFWILHNVVQNAIKYTDSGNISIGFEKFDRIIKNKKGYYIDHITKQPHYAEPNSELRQVGLSFTVKDSGIGIPSESHGTALTGTRGANAVKSGKPGNGQGLRTVNDILKSIDGDIQIQSPVNGKTFSDPNPGTEIACFIPFYELRT